MPVEPLADQLDLKRVIGGLIGDLDDLRAGTISVRDARARADLAREILRGVRLIVEAQKFLSGQALPAPRGGEDGET